MPAASSARRLKVGPGAIALRGLVRPPVVIAQHSMHAERRLELPERRRPFAGMNLLDEFHAGDIVAEQHDDIGAERIGLRDDRGDAIGRHPRIGRREDRRWLRW